MLRGGNIFLFLSILSLLEHLRIYTNLWEEFLNSFSNYYPLPNFCGKTKMISFVQIQILEQRRDWSILQIFSYSCKIGFSKKKKKKKNDRILVDDGLSPQVQQWSAQVLGRRRTEADRLPGIGQALRCHSDVQLAFVRRCQPPSTSLNERVISGISRNEGDRVSERARGWAREREKEREKSWAG